ncbi:hypothetical protein HAALTHF_37460n [Vreelandella aquamarina]|nr:hypothetical protein HAALTHF_37460n [Halomonas axialensis]
MFGVDCVRTVDELPEVPDLAVVCSPIEGVPKLIKKLGKFGVKAALVLSGGVYLDRDEDNKGSIRQRMLQAARESGIRVLGPECMGLIVPGKSSMPPTPASRLKPAGSPT